LRQFLKPIYIIISIIIAITIYFTLFHDSSEDEERRKREKVVEELYKMGDKIIEYIKKANPVEMQNKLFKNNKGVDLEDIALFIDTASISQDSRCKWDRCDINSSAITLKGHINNDMNNKNVDIMLIKRGKRVILKAIHIDNNSLTEKSSNFPFNITQYEDINNTKGVSNHE